MGNVTDEPSKNDSVQLPVAPIWRGTFEAIVDALIAGDWELETAPSNVDRVSARMASILKENVQAYGDVTLVPLPRDTWDSSVAMWTGTNWEVLIDLWTAQEGRSDLVLEASVAEAGGGYAFKLRLIYVP
ncbi:MAG: hypothetical protein WCO88_13850 [Actinomycetota bacterium]